MCVTWKTQAFYFTGFENVIKIAILLVFANCCNLIWGWLVNSKFSVGMYKAEIHSILSPRVLIDWQFSGLIFIRMHIWWVSTSCTRGRSCGKRIPPTLLLECVRLPVQRRDYPLIHLLNDV